MNGGRLNQQLGFQGAEERGLLASDYIKNSGSETRRGREGVREGGTRSSSPCAGRRRDAQRRT